MGIKTSINVKYDFSNNDIIHSYYASSTHSSIFKNVIDGLNNKSNIRAHIAYGPYGTGKSYVASLLLGSVSKKINKSSINEISDKFHRIDSVLSRSIKELTSTEMKYLPIIVNGYEGNISQVVIKAVMKELNKEKINLIIPGYFTTIADVINSWKKDYPITFDLFLLYLDENQTSIDSFFDDLAENPESNIALFNEIYKKLTSGAELGLQDNINLIHFLESVCVQLAKKKIGIFIVYDEFGRYLSEVKDNEINSFMQLMQDLAELANNGLKNLNLLFIAHKPLNHYFVRMDQSNRSEFSKVEKRYNTFEIKSDYYTFINIIDNYFQFQDISYELLTDDYIKDSRKFNPFSGMLSDTQVEQKIVKSLFPLHQITTYVLPKISSIFGQNERTMFSFLADEKTFGLQGFLNNHPGFYYPDYLIDYFFSSIDEEMLDDIKEFKIFTQNIVKIPTQMSKKYRTKALRIYKFLVLWKSTNGFSVLKTTSDFISYSLGIDEIDVIEILEELSNLKFAKFNFIENQWEIFQGSSLDINEEIAKLNLKQKITIKDLEIIYNQNNPYKFIYSQDHNNKFEITRFATIDYSFLHNNWNLSTTNADQKFVIYLATVESENPDIIFGRLDIDFDLLKDLLIQYYCYHFFLKSHSYIINYPNLESEMNFELNQIKRKLDYYYELLFGKVLFCINGKNKYFKNYKEVSDFLSKLFNKKYSRTLHIVNDQVNMYSLTKIQTNSLKTVLEKMIQAQRIDDLDMIFRGTQPADLVYFTIIKNIERIGNNSENILELKSRLNSFLIDNPKGTMQEFLGISRKEPFGIRPEVSILLSIYLVFDKWKDILFFMNESFIPNITANDLYDLLINKPDKLVYVYSQFDHENRSFLNYLEMLFVNENSNVTNKSISVRVCSAMYNWYISLPVITQQYEKMSLSQMSFLKIIASSRTNPEKAINDLLVFSNAWDEIAKFKKDLEEHFSNYLLKFEKDIYTGLGIDDRNQWFNGLTAIEKKTNPIALAVKKDITITDFFKNEVENIDITKWTKSSFLQLKNRIMEISTHIKDDTKYNSIIINGVEKAVKDIVVSQKAKITYDNIDNTIKATMKYLTDAELEKIIFDLLQKYVR